MTKREAIKFIRKYRKHTSKLHQLPIHICCAGDIDRIHIYKSGDLQDLAEALRSKIMIQRNYYATGSDKWSFIFTDFEKKNTTELFAIENSRLKQ